MSKKRPTESSWDSDEELLNDTSGNAITAFPKTSELDLLGDDGELDEDALLGVDESGAKTTTISFANDSLWPLTTRKRSKNAISLQQQASHDESHVNEQAFVFEETDTADLEDELNVGGHEEDGSGYHVGRGGDYTSNIYQRVNTSSASDDRHVDFTSNGMNSGDGEIGYMLPQAEQATYEDESNSEFENASTRRGYMAHETNDDASGVELEYEQSAEQEEQVHLEYEDSHHVDNEAKNQHYESESDSDDEDSRHSRGKFTSERTGVIKLTQANAREAIPDTLEINEEQAAQIEQFMSDKTQRPKARGRGQSRSSAHSRLGNRSNMGSQQKHKAPQGSRMASFPRGMFGQNSQMGFPFTGGPPNRGPFPVGLLNPRGPFPLRLLNQRGPFSGSQNQRQAFPMGLGAQRGSFSLGLNMLLGSGPQRGPFPQDRFIGGSNQRGLFTGGPPSLRSQRLPQQNLRSPQRGIERMRGPQQPNQLMSQGSFNQRMANSAQFGQRPPHLGLMGSRPPGPRNAGPRNQGPRNAGPRPLMGQPEPGMRFASRGLRPPSALQQSQNIPSLVKTISNVGKPLLGNQSGPGHINSQMPPDARRISPHQRLGPMQGQNRLHPAGLHQGPPRFNARTPAGPGGPFMNPPVHPGNQQPQMGGQGNNQSARKHKIYINPRFQSPEATDGNAGLGRTVKMGVPIQQKKAKVLLERAIQTQNKQVTPGPVTTQTGVKRKSTGDESVPSKVIKSDVTTIPAKPEVSSARVVQANNEPTGADSNKMKALMEEQKRKREIIQRKKELARQKQAAIKRKELETRLKEEGKTIGEILGTTKTEGSVEQNQAVPPAKQISGSVAARLGPPPSQQQTRGPQQQTQVSGPTPAKTRPPLTHGSSVPAKSQQFPGASQPSRNFQARTPVQAPVSNQLKVTGPDRMRGPPPTSDSRFTAPPPNSNLGLRGPPPTHDPRLQSPTANQFGTPQQSYNKIYSATQPHQDHTFRLPPPSTDYRLRGPPPMTDPRLRGPSHQATIQPSPITNQSVRYTTPPPPLPQAVRFSAPHSAPQQVQAQVPASQRFQPQYNPASAPPSLPPTPYPQPSQSDTAVYAPVQQYTSQIASYQPTSYQPSAEYQYQTQTQHPPPSLHSPSSQHFIQSATSQYQLLSQQQYQTVETSQYQAPPAHSQYQTSAAQSQYPPPAAQSHYQAPPAQTNYQIPPPQLQYQPPPSQSQYQAQSSYQATPAQPQYQAPPPQQYQNSAQSYSTASSQHYQQVGVGYYTEPQPIQTVTSQVTSTSPPEDDQRTVQHHTPVGQRIQTIGQRVQPATDAHMRSIIQNVVSQPSHVAKSPPARLIQSQAAAPSRVATDGQVHVLDGPQKILIQNVPTMATKETLIKICRHFGQVLGVSLIPEQGKAVVQFQKGEQAAKCVAKCDQKCLHKTRLTVKLLPS